MISFKYLLWSTFDWLDGDLSICAVVFAAKYFMWGHNFDTLLGEYFIEGFSQLFIQWWHNLIQIFNYYDITTESLIDWGHFQSDDATSNDNEIFGNFGQL